MGGRGVIRLNYVHAFRDRTGRMRHYFRRNGRRNVLPGLPGSSEFMEAYAALLGNSPKQVEQRPTARRGPLQLWRSATMAHHSICRCRPPVAAITAG